MIFSSGWPVRTTGITLIRRSARLLSHMRSHRARRLSYSVVSPHPRMYRESVVISTQCVVKLLTLHVGAEIPLEISLTAQCDSRSLLVGSISSSDAKMSCTHSDGGLLPCRAVPLLRRRRICSKFEVESLTWRARNES